MAKQTNSSDVKIKEFNSSTNFQALRKDINEALKSVGEKYGITLTSKNISYSTYNFTLKVEAEVQGVDTRKSAWEEYCKMYGFEKEDYGKTFTSSGETFQIVALDLKARKNFLIAKKVKTGEEYKFNGFALAEYLRNKKEAEKNTQLA